MMNVSTKQIINLYKICGTYAGVEASFGIPAAQVKKILVENGITEKPKKGSQFLHYTGLIPREQENNIYIDDDDLKNLWLKVLENDGTL